ncbi:MAG: hypothetical protein VKK04_04240 [Synechococcales bacterium]|nr:hypothetical protein [Synechococcales bacterium]
MLSAEPIEQLLHSIYADSRVSPSEIIRLRKAVDAAEEQIVASTGAHGIVATLFKSFDVTRQLLQDTVLEVRRDEKNKYSDEVQAQIQAAIEANIKLLQANLDAFAK